MDFVIAFARRPSGSWDPFGFCCCSSFRRFLTAGWLGIQCLCSWLLLSKSKSVSSAARPSSFLLISVKRNEPKKNAFLDEAIPEFRWYQDFSTRHPGSVEKRRTSLCAALRVSGCKEAQALEAEGEAKPSKLSSCSWLLRIPASRDVPRPEGRRAWMPAVFRPSQDGESENPGVLPAMGLLCREKRFSLVRFF
ncbi:hypothetical protein [Luteimonas panaciterrae]|uniref:hypothetical protein n=1 Tax=Luteimonas panaciterrae TaxID=363885 RepID=UPI001CFA7FA4|nr:hypothetical protein [Luteimonas panaciterrae]